VLGSLIPWIPNTLDIWYTDEETGTGPRSDSVRHELGTWMFPGSQERKEDTSHVMEWNRDSTLQTVIQRDTRHTRHMLPIGC